jgi:ribosomal protein L12E/L44/L45/RPP1/RPP2
MGSPIIFQDQSGIAEGISQAGSALAQAMQFRGQFKQQENQRQKLKQEQMQYGTILNNVLSNLPENPSPLQIIGGLSQGIQQGLPADIAQGIGSLYKSLQPTKASSGLGFDSRDDMVDLLERFGMSPEQAERESDLYMSLPTGGRSEYARFLFDRMQRGQLISDNQPQVKEPGPSKQSGVFPIESNQSNNDISAVEDVEVEQFQFPKVDLFPGYTPKEKVSAEKDLFNTNAKGYQEISTNVRSGEDKLRRLTTLEKLNNSKKLPEGLGRANINWNTGEIRVPAFANPETQLFAKSVVDFTSTAKDDYGARITNFDLGIFLKRLPTLANTEAGRRLILEQMKAVQGLDKLYNDSLKQVYDKYGLRGVDSQKAEVIAKELRKKDEEALIEKYNNAMNAQTEYEAREKAPDGYFPVKNSKGEIGYLPNDQLEKAKSKGYKLL